MVKILGFSDPRLVTSNKITIQNDTIKEKTARDTKEWYQIEIIW